MILAIFRYQKATVISTVYGLMIIVTGLTLNLSEAIRSTTLQGTSGAVRRSQNALFSSNNGRTTGCVFMKVVVQRNQ